MKGVNPFGDQVAYHFLHYSKHKQDVLAIHKTLKGD